MSKNSTNRDESKKYSRVQYFFWLWSGAEISILKDCPTDFNRQAGIGFTIFMTTMLAFCSGSYAGWYFGDSYLTAVVFGIIWSALIFSIDRSMVITLKKNPNIAKQNFWPALAARAVLAALIAFIISIPLELLIFQEEIQANSILYQQKQISRVVDLTGKNGGLAAKDQQYLRDSIDVVAANELLNQAEPSHDTVYSALKSNYVKLNGEYVSLSAAHSVAHNRAINAYNNVPSPNGYKDQSSDEWATYLSLESVSNKKLSALNGFNKQALAKADKNVRDYIKNWKAENQKKRDLAQQSVAEDNASIGDVHKQQDANREKQDSLTRGNKGFITHFMVLEDVATLKSSKENPAGATVFWLLWLIRTLFFVIEILPTISKIATPVGAYDIAIIATERDLAKEFDARTDDYLAQQKQLRTLEYEAEQKQVKERTKIETTLHKELVGEVASVQNDVARQKIEEFRQQHVKQNGQLNSNSNLSQNGSPKIEEVFWRRKGSPDKIEYLFRKGLNGINDLFYFENEELTKGQWSLKNNKSELVIDLFDAETEYAIAELTADKLKLTENGTTDTLEFEKT